MTAPFMRAYALLLLKTCHKRGAPAIGGMSALIPIKNDPEKNEIAMAGHARDKRAMPPTATTAAGSRIRGWCRSRWRSSSPCSAIARTRSTSSARRAGHAADLLNFQPETPITEAGLRMNINVGIHYLGAWLAGNGCVPIHNLMEDAATAEISRSQVWQWIRSPKGVLDDGRKVTPTWFAR
jgi:malate synthase